MTAFVIYLFVFDSESEWKQTLFQRNKPKIETKIFIVKENMNYIEEVDLITKIPLFCV